MSDTPEPSRLRQRLARLATPDASDLPVLVEAAALDRQHPTPEEARRIWTYLESARARATREAYRADLADFASWCQARGLSAVPAEPGTVARYLVDRAAALKVSTLTRRLAAINQAHQAKGADSPTASILVRKVFAGIRRHHGVAPVGKTPLLPDDLRAMVAQLGESLGDRRDRALLLLGFAGAFRRAELVDLNVEDLRAVPQGLIVTVRRSKTDQEGEGLTKGIPRGRRLETCPVAAVTAWQDAAGVTTGPLFRPVDRHGNVSNERLAAYSVVRVVKRLTAAIGLDPDRYGGHSLRAGLATAAAAAGAHERDIMRQTGHRSVAMLRRYIRQAELFRDNAADGLL